MLIGLSPSKLTLEAVQSELTNFYQELVDLKTRTPREILETLSTMTARSLQIRAQIMRAEDKALTNFRTKELDPFVEECDRQFKIWSRILTSDKLDWDMSRGY